LGRNRGLIVSPLHKIRESQPRLNEPSSWVAGAQAFSTNQQLKGFAAISQGRFNPPGFCQSHSRIRIQLQRTVRKFTCPTCVHLKTEDGMRSHPKDAGVVIAELNRAPDQAQRLFCLHLNVFRPTLDNPQGVAASRQGHRRRIVGVDDERPLEIAQCSSKAFFGIFMFELLRTQQ
jgi:hypothetical protein